MEICHFLQRRGRCHKPAGRRTSAASIRGRSPILVRQNTRRRTRTSQILFAIPDLTDDRCMVRDLARWYLRSDQIPDHPVFAWANNTKGVTRGEVNRRLKQAAVEVGLKASDTASHSCRITGLSQLLAHNMDFESARHQGRWASDSTVRRYFWPTTDLAINFAASIWEPAQYTRVRGGGAVQRIGTRQ